MRVLIVSHLALPHVGGVEILVDQEIRALVSAGHEVSLVTSDGLGSGQWPTYPPAVRVARVPAWHVLERRYRLPYPLFSPGIVVALWREARWADVIHVHGFLFLSSLLAALVGRLLGKRIILTDHGGVQRFDSRLKSFLVRCGAETVGRLTACCADRLVAYNTRIVRLLEQLTRRHGQVMFLPNPVNRALFQPPRPDQRRALRQELGWADNRSKVLFVGRFTPEKGVPTLLECVDPARYDLVFCGSGDPSLLGPLPRAGVELLPPRPQADLVKLYQAADVLVVPSMLREGFPLVVQEGLACGLPVVLGYDEGFEPYRRLAGLHFCEPTATSLRAIIRDVLSEIRPIAASQSLSELCPSLQNWIARLYEADVLPWSARVIPAEARS